MRAIPNGLTLLRFVLVVPIGWYLWHGEYGVSLLCMGVAGLSDLLDGYLARRFDSTSRFGELADPVADKVLALVVVLVLLEKDLLPLWIVAVLIGRDLIIVSGALAFRSIVQELEIAPLAISRVYTAVQIGVLLLIMMSQLESFPTAVLAGRFVDPVGLYLMVLFAIVSGGAYVYTWTGRLKSYLANPERQVRSADH